MDFSLLNRNGYHWCPTFGSALTAELAKETGGNAWTGVGQAVPKTPEEWGC